MRKTIIIMTILCLMLTSGCFSYKDMNRTNFSTMAIFDVNDAGQVEVHAELFTSERAEIEVGMEKRVLLVGTGETVLDAFNDMQTSATFPIVYDVNKAIVFTEALARQGVEDVLDSPSRNQKPTIKEFMFIYEGEPEELLHTQMGDEKYVGVFLEAIMVFQGKQTRIIPIRLNDFLNNRDNGSRINLIPLIGKSQKTTQDRIDVLGAAIMDKDKMVDKMTEDEVAMYKILTDEDVKTGSITVQKPQEEEKLLSLMILSNKTKTDIVYDGQEAVLSIDIHTITSLEEVQGPIILENKQIIDQIEKSAQEDIKQKSIEFFRKFQDKDIDILNVEGQLKRKFPNAELGNILSKTSLDVNVTVEIEGSQNKTDSQ